MSRHRHVSVHVCMQWQYNVIFIRNMLTATAVPAVGRSVIKLKVPSDSSSSVQQFVREESSAAAAVCGACAAMM